MATNITNIIATIICAIEIRSIICVRVLLYLLVGFLYPYFRIGLELRGFGRDAIMM